MCRWPDRVTPRVGLLGATASGYNRGHPREETRMLCSKTCVAALAALIMTGCAKKDEPPAPAAPAPAPAIVTPSTTPAPTPTAPAITTEEVSYKAGDTELKGFFAYPTEAAGPVPGVLVVHEWWGHNDYARARAKQLAELGYAALAVDMYGGGKRADHPADAMKFVQEVTSHMDTAVARFEAARKLLAEHPKTDPNKIAAIGYCFGGGVVLHIARTGVDLDAVASFHGSLGTETPMKKGAFAGKILILNGAADPFVPTEQIDAFKKEMDAAGADYEIVSYEGAKHGFTNPSATELGAKFQLPLAYDARADQASWTQLRELLATIWGT
jgi:dienelactone hydrolase